jgi:diguanylate cyclase (GGDEF)-like protein
MAQQPLMFGGFFLIVAEILLITFLNYLGVGSYYSLDVLYCLPVIQAARLSALRSLRRSDTQMPVLVGAFAALLWTTAEFVAAYPDYPLGAFVLNAVTRCVAFTIIGRVVANLWRDRASSRKDALTDLANRIEFFERFEHEQQRSQRSGHPYSILFIDIDQFKGLNDLQGHRVGDDALKTVADILRNNSRQVDTIARFGGDEFVVLFPETDAPSCEILVNRILMAAEKTFNSQGWQIALSVGYASETGTRRSADDILNEADRNMYSMKKKAGRGFAEQWGRQ